MIKQIMLDEIAEDVVKFRDSVTVNISQNIPQHYIHEFRIVKTGTAGTLVNNPITDHNAVMEGYKNLTMAIFKRFTNFTKYLRKDNKYNIEPITQNRNSNIVRF